MKVEKIIIGPLQTNCYLLSGQDQTIIIDPGCEAGKILENIPTSSVLAILLTHGHYDHVMAIPALKNEFPKAKLFLHQKDLSLLQKSLSTKPDGFLEEGPFSLSSFKFQILETPGHTPGSLCFKFQDHLFSGDTLFAKGVGRTDYPAGSQKDLITSLKKLKKLPPSLILHPGHEEETTLRQALERQQGLLEGF